MKHTEGPWQVHEARHRDGEFWATIGTADGRGPITDIVGEEGNHSRFYTPVAGMKYLVTPVEEQKANARLIAAAPDLLEAVQALLSCGIESTGKFSEFVVAIEKAKDAVSRATGEKP